MKLPFVFVVDLDNIALEKYAGSVDVAYRVDEPLVNRFDVLWCDPHGLALIALGADDAGDSPFMYALSRIDSVASRHMRWVQSIWR